MKAEQKTVVDPKLKEIFLFCHSLAMYMHFDNAQVQKLLVELDHCKRKTYAILLHILCGL